MKVAVLQFPGSNCDQDAFHLFASGLKLNTRYVWHKDTTLGDVDLVVVPGGFSYGDYLRCGAIARFSPVMKAVQAFSQQGGLVFGICNGFQILCESHLLPGVLLSNGQQQFACKNVFIKTDDGEPLKIPIAHGDGRYYADEKLLNELETNKQIIFRYCDENGNVDEKNNPNGTVRNIAGIRNSKGNVFGMMPHPERATSSALNNIDGKKVFEILGLN